MDTLSSSVSALKVPSFNSKPREFHRFNKSHRLPPPHHHQISSNPIISNHKSTTANNLTAASPFISASTTQSSFLRSSPHIHRKPATGYAAALFAAAQANTSTNSLDSIGKDVRRLSGFLKTEQARALFLDNSVADEEKGKLVMKIAERGKFHKLLMGLMKMLIQRKKVGALHEVLDEFERIYDEMIGTKVVMVSSVVKIKEDELLGIAKKVQRDCGALRVKVRNIYGDRMPDFVV